jgi:DNA-binding SARP family transcriptional activator
LLYQMAAAACSRGDFALAIEHGTAAASIAAETGAPLLDGFCHTELSFFLYRAGRGEEARLALTRGRRSAVGMNFVECLGLLYEAWFCLGQRQEGKAIPPLRSALALASRQGYSNFPHWDSLMMSTLCAFALAQSIEPDYVRSLIRKRNLAPPDPRTILETWPWPVRIHVLGQFKLEAAEALSVNTRKASRKPLELLGLLIASGTGGISIERAAEALWSTDRDGNGGEALRVALYRLRRMLGGEDRILTAEGRLILNERYCWVDAWRFERVLDAATTSSKSPAALPKAPISNAVLESALALYHGPFAPDEVRGAWALAYRERLHGLFVRAALELGMRFESEVPIEHAIAFYERVLQVDDLVEAFYQRLLACYGALGRRAEGLGVYARCQKRLRAGLGVTPSERTEALKTALLAGERPHVRSVSSNR